MVDIPKRMYVSLYKLSINAIFNYTHLKPSFRKLNYEFKIAFSTHQVAFNNTTSAVIPHSISI